MEFRRIARLAEDKIEDLRDLFQMLDPTWHGVKLEAFMAALGFDSEGKISCEELVQLMYQDKVKKITKNSRY